MRTSEYLPTVAAAHQSSPEDEVTVQGFTEKQSYSVISDIAKFSHPVAATISYLSTGFPNTNAGDNGFLHLNTDATLRKITDPVYTHTPSTLVQLSVRPFNQRSGALLYLYSVFDLFGNALASPLHVDYWYSYLGEVMDVVTRNNTEYINANGSFLPATIGAPKMVQFADWGPFFFHALEMIEGSGTVNAVRLHWIEWYSNFYGQYRKCEVFANFRLIPHPSKPHGNPYLRDCFDVSYSYHCESQWYQNTGIGPVHGTLTPTSSFVSDVDGVFEPGFCFPLRMAGGGFSTPPDISRLYRDGQLGLERLRVGCATSTVRLLETLRDVATNWVEFAGEASEIFSLIPLDIWEKYAGYFDNGGTGFLDGLADLLKALSSAYVEGQFSIAPLGRTGEDVPATIEALLGKLPEFNPRRIRSGRVKIKPAPEIFDGLFFTVSTVEVVSSCNIGIPFTGEIPVAASLDNIGVLPLPSRFWDLAPWSWCIDYFTHFQARLESVETILLLSIWRADGFTHSVHFKVPADQVAATLRDSGIDIDLSTPGHLDCYMREISALIPFLSLRETYHLADSDMKPNWLILLALLLSFAIPGGRPDKGPKPRVLR